MDKTLTISGYNRPTYFAQVIRALAWCDGVGEYQITAILDPSDKTAELSEIAKGSGIRVHIPDHHLGCGRAIKYAMTYGFTKSSFHVHLEDDTVPSPDCLRWFEWAGQNSGSHVLTISAYNQHGGDAANDACGYRNWFTPWGWATWLDRFEKLMMPAWDDNFWDGSVQRVREQKNMGELFPHVSRIQNIGAENGTFCPGPEFHKENQHATRVATDKETKWKSYST